MHHLDPLTALQITAGTTIDRPVAVIRELIDNAIDAGARHIDISVQDGGMHVTDDGCGMNAHDLALAFMRHTTSKIQHYDDIHTITTIGFRGEALASIAAIARVTCTSRTSTCPHARELRIAAGDIQDIRPCAGHVGTQVRVERLYYTAPHRRTFWRQAPHELQLIGDLVARYAVLFPHIAFRAHIGTDIQHATSGSGDLTTTIHEVWHAPVQAVIASQLPSSSIMTHGALVADSAAAPLRRRQVIAINQRPLAPRGLLAHVLDELLPPHHNHYPALVLQLTLPRDMIDINLKASKEEIGVRSPSVVARALYHALQPRRLQVQVGELPTMPFPDYQAIGYYREYVVAQSGDSLAIANPATIMRYCGIEQLAAGPMVVPPYPLEESQWQVIAPHQQALALLGMRVSNGMVTHLPHVAHQRPLSQGIAQLVRCLRQGGSPTMAVAAIIDADTLLAWLAHHPAPWQSQALYVIHHHKIATALRSRHTTGAPAGWQPPPAQTLPESQ